MTDLDALIALSERLGGGVAVLLGTVLIAALYTKRLVFGWLYTDCTADHQACQDQLAARVAKAEAELDDLRKERLRHERA